MNIHRFYSKLVLIKKAYDISCPLVQIPSKYIIRFKVVAGHSFMQLFPSLFNLILSWVVIRFYYQEWWGAIVGLQLIQYFATNFTAWGNKEFLLREFSRNPLQLINLWRTSFITRLAILFIPLLCIFLFNYSFIILINLFLWIIFRGIQQSFESLIIYQKKFSVIIWAELLSIFMLNAILIFYKNIFSYEELLWLISLSYFIKPMVMVVFYYKEIFATVNKWKIDLTILKQSFPFMLLGFTGLLQSKSDLICVIFYMNKVEIASYQVLMTFIILFQSLPSLIFTPYVKYVYRANPELLKSFQKRGMFMGIIICSSGIPVVYFILEFIYLLHFSLLTYLFAYFYVVSTFFYFISIYILYKIGKQKMVMYTSMATVGLNILACIILIPLLGIQGAMLANVISQAVSWLIYQRKTLKYMNASTVTK